MDYVQCMQDLWSAGFSPHLIVYVLESLDV